MEDMYPSNCENCFGCVHFGSMRRPFIPDKNGGWKIGCKKCTGYIKIEETKLQKICRNIIIFTRLYKLVEWLIIKYVKINNLK